MRQRGSDNRRPTRRCELALADLTAADAVLRALDEFDAIGRDHFLSKYGFSTARSYFLVRDGRAYDSKAIAGVAHGYQHPHLGPLRPSDFSGGDLTVRARLENLGFQVIATEPTNALPRPLVLFEDYNRREVHDMFAPGTPFTPGAGLWGLSGIVEHRPHEFVLFMSYGREQSDHKFDEGVTSDGVVTWQSQPGQTLADAQVKRLIDHDSALSNVRLFLRTKPRDASGGPMPYTYVGRVAYLSHDSERERPLTSSSQRTRSSSRGGTRPPTACIVCTTSNLKSVEGRTGSGEGSLVEAPGFQVEAVQFLGRLI
jgi:hypothetical protein